MYLIIDYLLFALQIYEWIFIAYIILSWLPVDPGFPLVRFVRSLIEPVYAWLLRILPPIRIGMLDLSPLYMVLFMILLRNGLRFLRVLL